MSELQLAYETSCVTYEYKHVVVPAGMFAVVECSMAHCPITDARLPGSNRRLIRLCGSRRLAEYFASKIVISEDDEVWVEVLPKGPRPIRFETTDEEIPF